MTFFYTQTTEQPASLLNLSFNCVPLKQLKGSFEIYRKSNWIVLFGKSNWSCRSQWLSEMRICTVSVTHRTVREPLTPVIRCPLVWRGGAAGWSTSSPCLWTTPSSYLKRKIQTQLWWRHSAPSCPPSFSAGRWKRWYFNAAQNPKHGQILKMSSTDDSCLNRNSNILKNDNLDLIN